MADEPRTEKQELDRLAKLVDQEIPESERAGRMPPMLETDEDKSGVTVEEIKNATQADDDSVGRQDPDDSSLLSIMREQRDLMRQIRDGIQEGFQL